MDEAITAREGGNYTLAITKAESVLGMLGAVADQEKGGFAGAKLSWDRNAIKEFINSVRTSKRGNSTAGGLQISKLRFVNLSNTGTADNV